MGQAPEAVTTTPEDIEATRANLSRDIDELTDKVSPGRVMDRQKEAAKGRLSSVKDKVMGSASSATSSVGSGGSSVKETASGAAGSVSATTQGNPLAAGLVAFGAGLLVSALIPASEKEAQVAGRAVDAAKEHGQPVLDEARSVGQEMGRSVKESATQAADEVKATAQDSISTVQQEGQSSVQTVKDEARPSS